jgi:hypothetical protein
MKTRAFIIVLLGLLTFASASPAAAYNSLVWRDYFDDNSGDWYLGDNAEHHCEISGGMYRITGKQSGLWVSYGLKIIRTGDYGLEAKLRGDATDPQHNVGIIWDMKDEKNYYQFVISGRGNYSVQRYSDGKLTYLADWTASAAISKTGFNVLKVRKVASYLVFSINGSDVRTLNAESYLGDYIGFTFSGVQTLSVDSVTLEEEKIFSGDTISLSDTVQTWYTTNFPQGSAPWLEETGTFKGTWDGSSATGSGYTLEHFNRDHTDYLSKSLPLDLTRDFSIVAQVKFLSGDTTMDYGIALDADETDFLKFGICAEGSFIIARYVSGKFVEIVPWTENGNINLYESSNNLAVVRRNGTLIFAINGRKVHEMAWDHWTSTKAGFSAHGAMKIRPLSLSAYETRLTPGNVFGNCSDGFGSWQYANGSRYIGFWKDQKWQGRGALYGADGAIKEGEWKEGAYVGENRLKPPFYYPVQTRSGDAGLVEASGFEKSFRQTGIVTFGAPLSGPIPLLDGKAVGFIDEAGTIRSSSSWSLASPFSGGIAAIKGGSGMGLINTAGKIVATLGRYDIDAAQDFSCGVVAVKKGSKESLRYGLINLEGQEIRTADLLSIGPYSGGLAAAKARNGLYGFIDLAGDWRILPKFHKVGDFHEGLAFAMPSKTSSGFIDSSGKIVFTMNNDQDVPAPHRFSEGKVWFLRNFEEAGFLDAKGAIAIPASREWATASPFSEGRALVSKGPLTGFIDANGAIAVPLAYQDARPYSMGLAAAKYDGNWGFLDGRGSWAIPPTYREAFSFTPEGLAQVQLKDGSWTWINRTGEPIWRDKTDASIILSNNFQNSAAPWQIGETDTIKTALTQGFYYIKAKQASGGISAIPLEIDRKGDYSLTVMLRYNSSSMNESIGLIWDIADLANFYALVLSPQGGYSIVHFKDGQAGLIVGWTIDAAVKKGMTDNELEIRRSGEKLEFLINGTMVNTLSYETINGQGIGFACFGATSLIVDSLTVRKGL